MDVSLKRIGAYLLDSLLVSLVASLLVACFTFGKNTNIDYEKYTNLISEYQDGKIEDDVYKQEMINFNYETAKASTIASAVTIVLIISYFGLYQVYADGQTIGKRILKIKVVGKDGEKLKYGANFIRMIILNNVIFRIISAVGVYLMNAQHFYTFSSVISYIEGLIETIILVMVILRQDGRGLHDFLAKTKVISMVTEAPEEKLEVKKEVIEAPVKEEKPKTMPKKKTTSKTKNSKAKNTKK